MLTEIKKKKDYKRKLQRGNANENNVLNKKVKTHKTAAALMRALHACVKLKEKDLPKKMKKASLSNSTSKAGS